MSSSSLLTITDSDDSYSSPSHSSMGPGGVARTTAEKAREKKLREDPMAVVLGPLYVSCKRCDSRIKLSAKSSYDPFHWKTHRSRCLKRHTANASKKSDLPRTATNSTRPKAPRKQRKPQIPPLSSSDESDPPRGDFEASHPILDKTPESDESPPSQGPCTPEAPQFVAAPRLADAVFEEYLIRSNRMKRQAHPDSESSLNWWDWSWSQLLVPQFQVASPEDNDDDDDAISAPMTAPAFINTF